MKNLDDILLSSYYNELQVQNSISLDRSLTRAEFLKLVLNSAGITVENADVNANVNTNTDINTNTEVNTYYGDVPSTHTLKNYIVYATRIGIVSGHNNLFRPDDLITRQEAAKIFTLIAGLPLATESRTFSDVSQNNPFALYIQSTFDNCLLNGRKTLNGETLLENGERVYEPESPITLAETAKVLYNIAH